MILDYLRSTSDGKITIPPFHTGHLGFIPGTEVSVALLTSQNSEGHCEVLVTPFRPNFSTLCRLTCKMVDQPGVVNRLIDAVASLNINIVKHESSAINSLDHHLVELVLDWHTSTHGTGDAPADVVSHFQELAYRLPIHQERYLLLYQAIMCRCGDVIVIDSDFGRPLPAITIVPFANPGDWSPHPEQGVSINRISDAEERRKGSAQVEFVIPERLLARIRHMARFPGTEPLQYILSSEAGSRSLRIFFPRRAFIPRIIHLAFTHLDEPGALSAITHVLAQCGFNILTGLLRKKTGSRSGYEVILEYTDPDTFPPTDRAELIEWMKEIIGGADPAALTVLADYHVQIGYPEYPKSPEQIPPSPVTSLPANYEGQRAAPHVPVAPDLLDAVIERIEANQRRLNSPAEQQRMRFMTPIRHVLRRKKVVFLSYPGSARVHGELLKKAIADQFGDELHVTDYTEADFQVIVQRVLEKIHACDFFLGIWHHDPVAGVREPSVSPWLPFEYGIALSAGKKTLMIHSDGLPERIWKRIDPAKAHPAYSDIHFVDTTIPMVLNEIRTDWLATPNRTLLGAA